MTQLNDVTAANSTAEIDPVTMIVRQLEQDIALGRLRPRERLIESELMLRFDAKRNAIRQCLAELEAMGVVQRPHNKSAMVRDFDAKEIKNIYLVRELLEAKAAELIQFPVSPQAIRELRNIHERHRSAAEQGDLARVFVENLAFHRMLFDLCGNPDLVEAIELFQKKSHAVRSFSIANARLLSQVTSEHEAMLKALDDQDRGTLMRLVVEHLSPAKNAYLESYVRR